ncbi:MAG: type IV secretory system conjugative DNA transfer family protein [Alphaproteobacteria bacterium]|nr:type IV secretory system conjugative DNA transfer family protein [Alphaproteobacteria bacterium]
MRHDARPRRSDGAIVAYRGDGHVITIAPTGAGKTAGAVIYNALTHSGQLIVIDIKGEVHQATARRRREIGQKVHVLDLRDGRELSDALNPLNLARMCDTDIPAIARSFTAEFIERHAGERDRFWNDWAENLIASGVAWQLADCPPGEGAVSRLFDLLTEGEADYAIAKLLDEEAFSRRHRAPPSAATCSSPSAKPVPRCWALLQHLRFFDSALIRHVTDRTTIDLAALIAGEPMSTSSCRRCAWRPIACCCTHGCRGSRSS